VREEEEGNARLPVRKAGKQKGRKGKILVSEMITTQ
jgi:hypothetical protein